MADPLWLDRLGLQGCGSTQHRLVSTRNTTLLGVGVPCQIRTLKPDSTPNNPVGPPRQRSPVPTGADPPPHAHGQLLPGAPDRQSSRPGLPPPGCEDLVFKAVEFCSLAQGQPSSTHALVPRARGTLCCSWVQSANTALSAFKKLGKTVWDPAASMPITPTVLVTSWGHGPGSGGQSACPRPYCCAWGQAGAT